MPIFEYKCEHCGASVETLVRSPDDIPTVCPECGAAEGMKKQLSTFNATVARAPSACADGTCDLASSCPSGGCCPQR
ncbi:MAG: FmdB family zinc ribbon protein [Verrucomicrobiota bacterium]